MQYYVYLGYVTVAKNQKDCGSCSAFASVGMVETAMIKAGAKKEGMDLSEDWLINCRQDGQTNVCKGTNIDTYAKYMLDADGFIHENSSPYTTQFGSDLGPCVTKPYWSPGYEIEDYATEWAVDKENELVTDEQIMMQIMEHGASIIAIYVSNQGSKPVVNYKKGVIDTCR